MMQFERNFEHDGVHSCEFPQAVGSSRVEKKPKTFEKTVYTVTLLAAMTQDEVVGA